MNRIFLIDGHAQIFRMYYAFMRRPMVNSKGTDTSILFGFTKMLLELISREHPTHIAVSFDLHDKTFRHNAYPEYKANRGAAPELVIAAMEPLQEILSAFNIPVITIPGYEADDIIGSMAAQWSGPDDKIFMVTPDKDYGQLISDNVCQYKPAKGGNEVEIIGKAEICSRYGISDPRQVIDILTVWGDSSDNIPGVKGIGEVGAKRLVSRYGSAEQILDHAGKLPQKQKEAVLAAAAQIPLSKFLVTIKTDIELPLSKEDIRVRPFDGPAVKEVFNKYEFNSLRKLVQENIADVDKGAEVSGSSRQDAPAEKEPEGSAIAKSLKAASMQTMADTAVKEGFLSVKMIGDDAVILSVRAKYFSIESLKRFREERKSEFELMKGLMENENIGKIGFGLKEIIKAMRLSGIDFNSFTSKGYLEGVKDLELMHYILNPERSHREEILIKSYLQIDMQQIETGNTENGSAMVEPDLFSAAKEVEKRGIDMMDIVACSLYAPLSALIEAELKKENQSELYTEIEMPLIGVLSDMEWEGVKIDTEHLHNYSKSLTAEMNDIEQQIRDIAQDHSLNISSPKQIGTLLFEKLRLSPKVKKSARGNYPTDEETLNEISSAHPVVAKILEFRALKKLLSTYIDALPEMIDKESGKVHTTFNQALTATGRLSSANPNLQNIPVRTERGKEIRKAFIPSSASGAIVSADYSQIELRLMAHMSGDPGLIDAFNHGKDIHTATAAKIFKEREDEVTKEQRSRAKTANFGIIYGISAFGLSQRMGISRSESKALIEEYFNSYPMVKAYMNEMIKKAKECGYVETIYGRRRFLPEINSRNAVVRGFNERNAINAPLQGSAADIIKVAMVRLFRRLKEEGLKSKIVLQVHDELVLDVTESEIEKVKELVENVMNDIVKLKVPLVAECSNGKNWLEAH